MDYKMRRRTRLKAKQARALREELHKTFGQMALWDDGAAVDTAEVPDLELVLVNGVVHALRSEGDLFFSVRGALAYRPTTRWVTVDMGAVRFVTNGADIMAPGITEGDPELQEGDLCWIRDEKNKQPLAIGRCQIPGAQMGAANSGKAVSSVHFLGDRLWELDA